MFSSISPCLISTALTTAMIYTIISIYGNNKSQHLINTFTDAKQHTKLYQVRKERSELYTKGYFIGVFLMLFYAYAIKQKGGAINYCLLLFFKQIITLVIYKFYPKQHNLYDVLVTDEQKREYEILSTDISNSYAIGFLLGIIIFNYFMSRK